MFRHRLLPSTLLACLLPASVWAVGPPLETPAMPDVPLGPVEPGSPPDAPPLALDLPAPPELPDLPGVAAMGAPDPLPIPDPLPVPPEGIPDLIGNVVLPPEAGMVFDVAPPFGGSPGHGTGGTVPAPEPGTALLLGLGLGAIAATRRR